MIISSDDGGGLWAKDEGTQAIDRALPTFAIAGRAGGRAVEEVGEGLLVGGVEDDKGAGDVGDVSGVVEASEDGVVDVVGAHDGIEVCAVVDAAATTLLADRAAFPGDEREGPAQRRSVGLEARDAGKELHEGLLSGVMGVGVVVEGATGQVQAGGPQRLKHGRGGRAVAVAQTSEVVVQAAAGGRVHGSVGRKRAVVDVIDEGDGDDGDGSTVAVVFAIARRAGAVIADGGGTGREAGDGDEQREDDGLDLHERTSLVRVCWCWAAPAQP